MDIKISCTREVEVEQKVGTSNEDTKNIKPLMVTHTDSCECYVVCLNFITFPP